jgi:hypothetical protein
MRDTGVNGRGLPLDGGASCIHDLPPLYVGQRLDGAAGPLHRPPTGKAWQWVADVSLMAIRIRRNPLRARTIRASQSSATNEFCGHAPAEFAEKLDEIAIGSSNRR